MQLQYLLGQLQDQGSNPGLVICLSPFLTAIFPGGPGQLVSECLHSGFIEAKGEGGGGNNWSYKTCKLQNFSQIIITNKLTPHVLQARLSSCHQTIQ